MSTSPLVSLTHGKTRSFSRKILSTEFPSSLRASLAIDAAVASSSPVTWLPASWNPPASRHLRRTPQALSDDDDEDDEPLPHRATSNEGVAVCQVVRGTVRYIAPVKVDSQSFSFSLSPPSSRCSLTLPRQSTL